MTGYTIGQLAKAADVPTSTVRYYERSGLLKPDYRTGGNYRGYSAHALERLRFIRSAQATGLSLSDIAELFNMTDGSGPPCDGVTSLLQKRLNEIRARIVELQHVEKVLHNALHRCCKGHGPDLCTEIHRLSHTACKSPGKKVPARA